jgi:hypothetical protein
MDQSNPGHATEIDGQAVTRPDLYHPTFLYELLWDLGVGLLVWLLDRKYKFGRGRAFALYVMAYTAGRLWIEMLRIDDANHFFGIRLNVFTAIVVFLGALAYFLLVRGPRAYVVPDDAPETAPEPAAKADDVSAVDVTEPAATGRRAPKRYQVVSEARFEAYQRTGILPPDTDADRAQEIAAGGHPKDPADPSGPAGAGEAVLATGAAATNGPEGVSGGDADVDSSGSPRPTDD